MKSKLCTIVISILIALSFSACSSGKNWNFISATSFFGRFPGDKISVNPSNGNIIAAAGYHPAVLYLMQDLETLERIPLPAEDNKIEILDMCYADEIWIVTFDDQTLSYDPGTQSWTLHPELVDMHACYVTPDSRLILWNADELHIYDSQWVTTTISSSCSPFITQNAEGSLWLLAGPAELYKLDQNGLSFVKSFDILNAVQLFVPSTGDVWIVTQDHIYVWRPTDADKPLESILDFTDLDLSPAFWIYEDSTGTIWIVTRDNIWAYTGTQFETIDLPLAEAVLQYAPLIPRSIRPRLTWPIWGAAFDHQKDRLYVTTDNGIYYLDVLDPSVQGSK